MTTTTDWAELAKKKSGEILSRLKAQTAVPVLDCGLAVIQALEACGHRLHLSTEGKVVVSPPPATDGMRMKIREHLDGIKQILKPPPEMDFPLDWQREAAVERDILLRRVAACGDAANAAALRELATAPIRTAFEWSGHWFLIKGLEERLRRAGALPPAIFPTATTPTQPVAGDGAKEGGQ